MCVAAAALSCSSTVSEQAVKEVASNVEMIAADVPRYSNNEFLMDATSLWRNRNFIYPIVALDGTKCGAASSLRQPTKGEDKGAPENLLISYGRWE